MSRRELRALVIDLAASTPVGETITFSELSALLGIGDGEREELRFAVNAAKPPLLREHGRALVSVRNEGYRVAAAAEHASLARRERRSSDRKVRRAVDLLEYADLTQMDDRQRAAHERTRKAVLILAHAHAQLADRMSDHEERLAKVESLVYKSAPR